MFLQHLVSDTFSLECPINFPTDVMDMFNEITLDEKHGGNFTCRYLSFLDTSVATPGNYINK